MTDIVRGTNIQKRFRKIKTNVEGRRQLIIYDPFTRLYRVPHGNVKREFSAGRGANTPPWFARLQEEALKSEGKSSIFRFPAV
jgi:hypothetical protein